MRITTRIRNFIFLWRENKKQVSENVSPERILPVIKSLYKTKGCVVRNLTCSLIKKYRAKYPYVIKDYSKAKKFYDSREPLDISKVTKDSYIVRISDDYPVKGDRWCEYYVNGSIFSSSPVSQQTFKIHDKNSRPYSYWSLEDYKGNWNHFTVLKEDTLRAFRFATEVEISNFKNRRKNYKTKLKQIEEKQQEINKLRNEL